MPDDAYLYSDESSESGDPRIRAAVGDYRCVAPSAKRSGGRVYANGELIIEKRSKDALGNPVWILVGRISRPTLTRSYMQLEDPANQPIVDSVMLEAIYCLLAGSVS